MNEATIDNYHNVYEQPSEMLLTSIHHFRDMMGSTKYTLEQKENAFSILLFDYMRCKSDAKINMFFMSTKKEWEMRVPYEIMREVRF